MESGNLQKLKKRSKHFTHFTIITVWNTSDLNVKCPRQKIMCLHMLQKMIFKILAILD